LAFQRKYELLHRTKPTIHRQNTRRLRTAPSLLKRERRGEHFSSLKKWGNSKFVFFEFPQKIQQILAENQVSQDISDS